MQKSINWKLFTILLVASVISGFMVIPYIISLQPNLAEIFTPTLVFAQIAQFLILFSIAIYFGLKLGSKVELGAPILVAALRGEKFGNKLKEILKPSIGWGVCSALLIIVLSFFWQSLSLSFLQTESSISIWRLILVPFYGGIAEEILLRLFLMTLLVWIFSKFSKGKNNQPSTIFIWLAIFITAIIFGLGHLPMTSSLAIITPLIVVRAILLNGIAGVIFGWLYWKKGLESAMIAHFTADVVLHIVLPIIGATILK